MTDYHRQIEVELAYPERSPDGYWHFRCVAKQIARHMRGDGTFLEPPDPFCECGAKNLVLWDFLEGCPQVMVGFSETCYECGVVSSD